MRVFVFFLLFSIGSTSANEKPIAYPVPATFPSKSGKYIFVLIPPRSTNEHHVEKSLHEQIRQTYPRSGLYLASAPESPLWTVDWYDYEAFPCDDGVHLVRIHGENDQWRHYKTDKRLPEETVEEQLASPAISFYANGELLRTYSVREIVGRPDALPHTMRYILWNAGCVFTVDNKQFVLMTQDERQVFFDLATGQITINREAGSKNAQEWVMRLSLAIVGTAIVVVMGIYLYHLRRR